jgi:DNA-binding CsgD family transcriptional regulator
VARAILEGAGFDVLVAVVGQRLGGSAMSADARAVDTRPEEQRSIREGLSAHRWLLDAMLEQFPNGSVNVFDRDLRYLYAAGSGLERAGLSPLTLIGKRLSDLFPADSVAHVEPYYARAFGGETVVFALPVLGRDYTVHASPLREPGGDIVAVVAIAQEAPTGRPSGEALTPRQREVAALITAGLTNEQIAHRLVITPGTVANHVEGILRRLKFVGREQVAVWAAERGLRGPGGSGRHA